MTLPPSLPADIGQVSEYHGQANNVFFHARMTVTLKTTTPAKLEKAFEAFREPFIRNRADAQLTLDVRCTPAVKNAEELRTLFEGLGYTVASLVGGKAEPEPDDPPQDPPAPDKPEKGK